MDWKFLYNNMCGFLFKHCIFLMFLENYHFNTNCYWFNTNALAKWPLVEKQFWQRRVITKPCRNNYDYNWLRFKNLLKIPKMIPMLYLNADIWNLRTRQFSKTLYLDKMFDSWENYLRNWESSKPKPMAIPITRLSLSQKHWQSFNSAKKLVI